MNKILIIIFTLSIIGCQDKPKKVESRWINLFDGTSLDGWRAYNSDKMPPGWSIIDSVLTFKTEQILEKEYDYVGSSDIIYGAEEFNNFELYVEWKIPKGGNSGIFYHIKEGYDGIPEVSPEYQLLDDENYEMIHNYKLKEWQKTAADYAMHLPDSTNKKLNPYGNWNSSRILFTTERVEHWLNGRLVLSFTPWSDDWYMRKNSGKFDSPDYGIYKTGYIGFQDHGSDLWLRNIKIKKF